MEQLHIFTNSPSYCCLYHNWCSTYPPSDNSQALLNACHTIKQTDKHLLAREEASQRDVAAFQSNCWILCCKWENWTKLLNTASCTTTCATINLPSDSTNKL